MSVAFVREARPNASGKGSDWAARAGVQLVSASEGAGRACDAVVVKMDGAAEVVGGASSNAGRWPLAAVDEEYSVERIYYESPGPPRLLYINLVAA
jgi:hypothetical protein